MTQDKPQPIIEDDIHRLKRVIVSGTITSSNDRLKILQAIEELPKLKETIQDLTFQMKARYHENSKLKAAIEELKKKADLWDEHDVQYCTEKSNYRKMEQENQSLKELQKRIEELDLEKIIKMLVSIPAGDVPTDTYIILDELEDELIKIQQLLGEKKEFFQIKNAAECENPKGDKK